MGIQETFGSKLFSALNYLLLILLSLSILYPFIYIFSISTSDGLSITRGEIVLFPKGFNINAYKQIFTPKLGRSYLNSTFYSLLATFFTLFFCSLGAYPLAQDRFKAKAFFTIVFSITMFFSGGMIPNFFLIQKLGLLDSFLAVTLPGAFGFWNIVILRTNFRQLPSSLVESAVIDGASDMKILAKIVIPLSKAILATITLWTFVGKWNDYFGPLLYLNSSDKEPLTIFLRRVLISKQVEDYSSFTMSAAPGTEAYYRRQGIMRAMRMATVLITIGPIVAAYPFIQKYFVKGVLVGSIKG
jgi:putative aldouronate transport system permease protein